MTGIENGRWLADVKRIDALEAEIKQLREQLEYDEEQINALQDKLGLDCCACSYDKPGDVCMVHSPMLRKAEAEIKRLLAKLEGK